MRKQLSAVVVALLVCFMSYADAPTAEAAYLGAISAVAGYSMDVVTTSIVTVTTVNVSQRGTLTVSTIDHFDGTTTIPVPVIVGPIPKQTIRIILFVDAMLNESTTVKITSGSQRFEVVATPSTTIQFDVTQ